MASDPEVLDHAAGEISDGSGSPWTSAGKSAPESVRPLLLQMEAIARIAEFHRGMPAKPSEHRRWGRFEILESLGKGAFAEVFRAWDPRLRREVALKLLHSTGSDASSRSPALLREARMLARVRHPNVVVVHDAEQIGAEVGLCMELVRGRTLEQLLARDGPLDERQATEVGIDLARALAAVHQAGLVHRDVKAQNVMRADDGRLVLMDFGAGQDLGGSLSPEGTPVYAAPELFAGQAPTAASDVYSTGVLLYHLVTGSFPVQGASTEELRAAHARGDGESLRVLDGRFARLAPVLVRALAPDPAARYPDGAALADALESLVETPALDLASRTPAGERAPSLVGRRLGSYQVLSRAGAGTVGEVYLASDGVTGREVAIEVLPEAFARDTERRERLRRAVDQLATLEHPNIAAVHDLQESEGRCFLVRELVPGRTLAERLAQGPLAVPEALGIGLQIAEALEAAHEKGILHGDLKPACVQVTTDGSVKVLDVGLARAFAGDAPDSGGSRAGVEGTGEAAAYTSAERARGEPVDRRTDIWSFGCLLYEALSGRRALGPEAASGTVAPVLTARPDWDALPEATPANIRLLLHRCLERVAKRRLHDIADARIEIEDALAAPVKVEPSRGAGARGFPWLGAGAWSLSLLAAAVAGLVVWNRAFESGPPPVVRFTLPVRPLSWARLYPAFAFSPDGTRLVYLSNRDRDTSQLYLRRIDQLGDRPIPGTEGGCCPFFSPDGEWIGFYVSNSNKLSKIGVEGGAPIAITQPFALRGASWGPDDSIVFTPAWDSGLWRVSAGGGTPQPLTVLDSNAGEQGHWWPMFLPGGKAVLFTVQYRSLDAHIAVQSLETGKRHVVIRDARYARYVSTGHLIYARAGTLWGVRFDPAKLQATGPEFPILDGVMQTDPSHHAAQFDVSSLGWLVHVPGGEVEGTLVWVDRKGAAEPLAAPPRAYVSPHLAPDGRRLAVAIERDPVSDLFTYDLSRDTLMQVTFDGRNHTPVWTPDGRRLAFSRLSSDGSKNLFWMPAEGGEVERLTTANTWQCMHSWSPDGRMLAFDHFSSVPGRQDLDVSVLPLDGARQPQTVLATPSWECAVMFSPDGRRLAYVSGESGRAEVYVVSYPGPGGKWQISNDGGGEPVWARSGRELFYRNGDKMMAVDIATEPSFSAGKPKLLFEGRYNRGRWGGHPNYDVTPDGRRFLMVKGRSREQDAPNQLNVVQNWLDELKRRAAAAK